MNQESLNVQDGSGDKDFFTIIPNYIVNHSSAVDQSLYLQLKRLAGDGKKDYCYPSIKYLMKQMKVGKSVLRKSFKYLIAHKWIDDLGKRQIHTNGGAQWINAYRINNIWQINSEYYKGGLNRPSFTKGGLKQLKGGLKSAKGGLMSYTKEERIKERKEERKEDENFSF